MDKYRVINVVLDSTEIFRNEMAEYALIAAGKNRDDAEPMQYDRCNMEAVFSVTFVETVGQLCSQMMGYVDECVQDGETMMRITMRLPAGLNSTADSVMRRRIEDYLVAAGLERCMMSVPGAATEYVALGKRMRAALRSIRNMLAYN